MSGINAFIEKADIALLVDVKIFQMTMIRKRGYIIPDSELPIFNYNQEQFNNYLINLKNNDPRLVDLQPNNRMYRILASQVYYRKNDDGTVNNIYVYYGGQSKINQKNIAIDEIRSFINNVNKYHYDESIMIVNTKVSKRHENELKNSGILHWQIFHDEFFLYDPTEHILYQRHDKMTIEEINQLKSEIKIKLSQLPTISSDDKIVQYYNWKINDVIRIYRDDNILENKVNRFSIHYRIVKFVQSKN